MQQSPPNLQPFDGPIDLLLELINSRELDITTVSLAAVAEQYLEEVSRLREEDLERLSAYLVIASRLLLIKSQLLLPRPVMPDAEDEPDDGADLLRQIEEYRRYKEVALGLRALEESRRRMFSRQAQLVLPPRPAPGAGSPLDLVGAFHRALAVLPPALPEETVTPLRYTVASKIAELVLALGEAEEVSFTGFVSRATCRAEVIALFLALLELVRRGRAIVTQDELFGEITLARPPLVEDVSNDEPDDGANAVDRDVDRATGAGGDEGLVEFVGHPVDDGDQPSEDAR